MQNQTLTIDDALKLAVTHHREGRLQEAEKLYRAILSANPSHPDANHNLGVIALSVGQPEAALPLIRKALESVPNNQIYARTLKEVESKLHRGGVEEDLSTLYELREKGEYQKALELLPSPKSAEAWALKSQLHLSLKNEDEAQKAIEEGFKIDPQNHFVLRNLTRFKLKKQMIDDAFGIASALYQKEPNNPENMVLLAAILSQKQSDDKALALLQAALSLKPEYAEAYANLGLIYFKQKQNEKSLQCLERALVLKPHITQLYKLAATVCYGQKMMDEAIKYLNEGLKREPQNVEFITFLGELKRQSKDFEGAIETLQSGVAISPDDPALLTNLATVLHEIGRVEEATELYKKVISINPNQAEVYNNLGKIYLDLKEYAEAISHYKTLLTINPNFKQAHYALAVALVSEDKADEAESYFRNYLRFEPESVDAHLGLANCLKKQSKYEEAEQLYRKALSLEPDTLKTYKLLGSCLLSQDKFLDAKEIYQKCIELKPEIVDSYINLGNSCKKLLQFDEAKNAFEKAIELEPDRAESYNSLALLYVDEGDYLGAAKYLIKAIELKSDFGDAYNNIGNIMFQIGKYGEAEKYLSKAVEISPEKAGLYSNLAAAVGSLNRLDESKAIYAKALEIDPQLVAAYAGLAKLESDSGNFTASNELIERALEIEPDNMLALSIIPSNKKMKAAEDKWWIDKALSLLDSKRLSPPMDRYWLLYSIGKYFDDVREYERAFEYYEKANSLKKSVSPEYKADIYSSQNDKIIASYTAKALSDQKAPDPSSIPLFIVGMPRSGTSLVEQILSSHPLTFGAGELYFWPDTVGKYPEEFLEANFSDELPLSIAKECLANLRERSKEKPEALRVIDKMPSNFSRIGLIHKIFPNAKFIHTMRNPIDTCLSNYFQNFATGQYHSNSLDDLAHYYREYHRLMEHWRSVLPEGVMLDVRYEDVVEDHEGWSRKIIEHIGLEWDDRCLEFHKTERKVGTASNWQARQPIYKSSKERWRNYEKFVEPLLPLLKLY